MRTDWLTCDHFVGKVTAMGSTNQANSAFHPFGVGKMNNNPCNYMD